MRIFVLFLLAIFNLTADGQLLGLNVVPVPNLSTKEKTGGSIYDRPGYSYANSTQSLAAQGLDLTQYNDDTIEDSFLTAYELVAKYGYPCKVHTVVTKDNYILEIHHIPGSPRANNNGQPKIPIFLMHGMLDSSSTFVIMGPGKGLGYLLADMGYDVWMGNTRGNRYSRKHVTLNPDGVGDERFQYWNNSWHESGMIDLPRMIDYVLEYTGCEKLHYVGHSQGGTIAMIMTSELPEYNKKLISMQLLAPAVFMSNCKGPVHRILTLLQDPLDLIVKTILGMYEFLPHDDLIHLLLKIVCNESSLLQPLVCANIFFLLYGFNPEQLNYKMLPVIAGHVPAGTPTNNICHFMYLIRSGLFHQYNHGPIKNLSKYGSINPPEYNLQNVKAPVYLYYSDNDLMVAGEDVRILAGKLTNVCDIYRVADPNFSHIDFNWAIDIKDLLYNRVFHNIKLAEKKNQN